MVGETTEQANGYRVCNDIKSEFADFTRPPEQEIYGRSLSTIRRLGAFMIINSLRESIHSPEAAQARVEFYTSVEEGFGTDMELGGGLEVRDYDTRPVMDGRVMSKDLKTAISDMTDNGLKCAEETVKTDKQFRPQLTRSYWDHQNALTIDQMVQGKTGYNTRIVVSPFPEEAAAQVGDEYWQNIGYVPHLRRGFVQVYHVTEEGAVISGSLSFDGSNKQRLKEIFAGNGVEIPDGEVTDNWLKYAITQNLSEKGAKGLAEAIADQATDPQYKKDTNTAQTTKQHKVIMDKVFDESYVHLCESLVRGRQTEGARKLILELTHNAHYLNERYQKALYGMCANQLNFTDDDSVVLHELLVYSTIEMMRALHLKQDIGWGQQAGEGAYDYIYDPRFMAMSGGSFQSMLSGFAAEGARHNRTYSACGLKISAGKDDQNGPESPDFNPQTAFGGNDKKSEDSAENADVECDYKGTFCYCCPYNTDGTSAKKLIVVTARRDKSGVARCQRGGCGASLDSNGNARKGRIYERAMLLQKQQEEVAV